MICACALTYAEISKIFVVFYSLKKILKMAKKKVIRSSGRVANMSTLLLKVLIQYTVVNAVLVHK